MTQAVVEYPVTLVVAKTGDLVWLGHLDFARAIERSLRRSGLPLRYTEGFHKRVKLRLPEPLPLGVGSEGERFVVPLAEERQAADVQAALEGTLPRGLALKEVISGFHPEPKDAPIELLLETKDLAVLVAAFAALPKALPAIGGTLEVLEPPRLEPGSGTACAVVRLVPPAGTRVSIGRFLALLNEAAPGSSAERPLVQARRRVAWHAEAVSLPSSARIAPIAPIAPANASDLESLGDQESSPCTP